MSSGLTRLILGNQTGHITVKTGCPAMTNGQNIMDIQYLEQFVWSVYVEMGNLSESAEHAINGGGHILPIVRRLASQPVCLR